MYVGKAVGQELYKHLHACTRHLDIVFFPGYSDVLMRLSQNSDGSSYYKYVLLYTYDMLEISKTG